VSIDNRLHFVVMIPVPCHRHHIFLGFVCHCMPCLTGFVRGPHWLCVKVQHNFDQREIDRLPTGNARFP
jgi:hypothetical protein